MIVIEKGVPIPGRAKYGSLCSTFRKMKAGDSVFFPGATTQSIHASARYVFGSGNYSVRKQRGGVRVWRTA